MSKLNRELIKKWIAALRSGKYEQHRGALRTHEDGYVGDVGDVGFCCLGVLREIEPGIERLKAEVTDDYEELLDHASLKQFLGVGEQDGFFQNRYAEWNDEGMPFCEIADRLEKRWLKNEEDNT